MTAGAAKWWRQRWALRVEIMRLIVQDWVFFKTPEETRQHLVEYLSVRTDWLPCGVEAFIRDYIDVDGFWPALSSIDERSEGDGE